MTSDLADLLDLGEGGANPAGSPLGSVSGLGSPPPSFTAAPPAAVPAPTAVHADPPGNFDEVFSAARQAVEHVFRAQLEGRIAELKLQLAAEKKRADDASAGAQMVTRLFPDKTPEQVEEQVNTWKQLADGEARLRQFLHVPGEVATFDMLGRAFNAVQSGLASVSHREARVVEGEERNAAAVATSKRKLAEELAAMSKRLCVP